VSDIVEIEATTLHYYSRYDEDSFFRWLDKLSCVHSYKGHLRTLYIKIKVDAVTQEDIYEIVGLYQRYDLDMSSLAVLERSDFSAWFRDERKYWYPKIFGQERKL